MSDYISRDGFVEAERNLYCINCDRRRGLKNGKYKTLYEIGEAPCRACEIDDVLNDVEDFPAADVREVVRGKWERTSKSLMACSACGNCVVDERIGGLFFCPNCGADMRGEADGT